MRVAQVVASYYPRLGGVETHVRRIAQGCAMAGDDVTVLTHQFGDEPTEESLESVRILRFPLTVRSEAYPFSAHLSRYLRAHASEFDLVHAHSYHTLAGQAAASSGCPFVFTPHYHGTGGHTTFGWLLHRGYEPLGRRLFGAADSIICVSEAELRLVARDFPDAVDKVTVIPNGTDPRTKISRVDDGPGADDHHMILTVGRLERYKNVDLVIKAFRALASPAKLMIVGDGPDRARLEKIARSTTPGWPVQFAGKVPDQELEELLAKATVVTSASQHEAFGLILADGLASGARVVASDIEAHREVGELATENAPITFIDPHNIQEFTAGISAALRMGRGPVGNTRLCSWNDVVAQIRQTYLRVTSNSSLTEESSSGPRL